MKNLILILCLLMATLSCKIGDNVSPSTSLEVFNSQAGTLIGSPISKVIGVAGGSLALPSAGANVIVPAGAMAAGATLTVQATTDMLDSDGQGIQISGTWSKPITLEYNYAADDLNPESNMIAFQTPKGNWITSRKVKVDKTKRTFAIRLGQNNTANARLSNGRPMANSYSFAASHEFFLKPDQASVDLGGTVKFTAFARQGDTNGYWRKSSKGIYYYDDGELVPLSQPSAKTAKIDDDDELVPLTPYVKPANADLDDELVPLTVAIKEAAFTNTKEGYTRKWSLSGVGTITNTGSIGADYKAPSDASAKGKTVIVTFSSVNNKTGQPLEASAKVFIKDGITRYAGTVTINTVGKFYGGTGLFLGEREDNWKADLNLKFHKEDKDDIVFISDVSRFNSTCSSYFEAYYSSSSGKEIDRKTQNGASIGIGEKAGKITLTIEKKTNTYEIKGWLETENASITRKVLDGGDGKTYNFSTYTNGLNTSLYVDIANLIKPFDAKNAKTFNESIVAKWDGLTFNTSWNFKKLE